MQGLIHIYCGEGKGKTTSALGLAVRASGNNMKVLIISFLKNDKTSEFNTLKNIENIEIITTQNNFKFVYQMNEEEKAKLREYQNKVLNNAFLKVKKENINMLILDEVFGAIETNTIDKILLDEFINNKPVDLELVMTGRYPNENYIKKAHYVSKIECIKHPYEIGINARKGIEF